MSAEQLVTKLSPRSVADTVARLSEILAEKGVKLFAVIDHSGEAESAGLELRDTKVVMFGNPQAGTPVMQARPLAALAVQAAPASAARRIGTAMRSSSSARSCWTSGESAR